LKDVWEGVEVGVVLPEFSGKWGARSKQMCPESIGEKVCFCQVQENRKKEKKRERKGYFLEKVLQEDFRG